MRYRKEITDKIKAESTSSANQRRDQRLAESNAKIKKYNEDLANDTEEQTQPQLKKSTSTSSSADQRRDQRLAESNAKIKQYNESLSSDVQSPKATTFSTSSSSSTPSSSSTSSFGKAFSEARKAGNKDFDYQGKKYAAVTKEEVDKSGSKNLTEYLNKNKSTSVADKGKTEPDDYSQLDTSVQRTATSTGKTEPDDYSQLDTSVQKTSTADSSDIFSSVKKLIGLRKGGMSDDMSMERARGVTPEQFAEEHKTPHSKNKYKDGGDIHVTKGHDYIKDLL